MAPKESAEDLALARDARVNSLFGRLAIINKDYHSLPLEDEDMRAFYETERKEVPITLQFNFYI